MALIEEISNDVVAWVNVQELAQPEIDYPGQCYKFHQLNLEAYQHHA